MYTMKNKTVFITGASSGIGAACAATFADAGARLILAARRIERLQALVDTLKNMYPDLETHLIHLDVTKQNDVNKAIENIPPQWKQIDVLVNNAGLAAGREKLQDADVDDWEAMIDTNVKGLLYVTKAVIQNMLQRGAGHIINIGSVAGHHAYTGGSVYCASKAAVRSITKALREDICGSNVRVSEIDPGAVETEFSLVRFKGNQEAAKNVYKGMTPLSAEDVADAVVYCATRPLHVNVAEIVLYPTDQASVTMTHRTE